MLKRLLRWFSPGRRRTSRRYGEPGFDETQFDLHPDASPSLLHALDELPPMDAATPAPSLDGPAHSRSTYRQHAYGQHGHQRSTTKLKPSSFMSRALSHPVRAALRWLALLLLATLALQIFFAARIALMARVNPQSTAFERSEALRLWQESLPDDPAPTATAGKKPILRKPTPKTFRWRQQWVNYEQITANLKRAVIASEDDSFSTHTGVDWVALQEAWLKNAQAQAQADMRAQRAPERRTTQQAMRKLPPPKVVGGSTITQQLAKNLFLSGERTLLRKAQELALTLMLEALLDKRRILEIYLNHVEWGEGIFGAQAAAQRYYGKNAGQLGTGEACRLAVMLPRPRYFEKLPNSTYLPERAGIIESRLWYTQLP